MFRSAVGRICECGIADAEPVDTEEDHLCMGYEHAWILVSAGGSWNQSPVDTKGQLYLGYITRL